MIKTHFGKVFTQQHHQLSALQDRLSDMEAHEGTKLITPFVPMAFSDLI